MPLRPSLSPCMLSGLRLVSRFRNRVPILSPINAPASYWSRTMRFTILALLLVGTACAQTPAPAVPDDKVRSELERAQKTAQRLGQFGPLQSREREPSRRPRRGEKRGRLYGRLDHRRLGPKIRPIFSGKPYINRGISGQTTPQMLIRFRPDVIAHKPKAVVILAGTNDIAGNTGPMTLEEIEGNLASMANSRRPTASRSSSHP